MRNPTDDDRALYLALREELKRLGVALRAMGHDVRDEFVRWQAGTGPGPTFESLHAWEQLQDLERAVRDKIDSVVAEIMRD